MRTTPDGFAGIVTTRGWPGKTLAGNDGAHAAPLLAQHADHGLLRQRAFLDALRDAVAGGEAPAADLAYLEDRMRVNGRAASVVRHPVHRH